MAEILYQIYAIIHQYIIKIVCTVYLKISDLLLDTPAPAPDPDPPQRLADSSVGDLLTCGHCGQEFPLPSLAAFIGHKSLGTCRREPTPGSGSAREATPGSGSAREAAPGSGSPSVTASDQVERVESSGGEGGEEEQADAATNTTSVTGSTLIKKKIQFSSYIKKFRVELLQSHI
jgi:hypothetical protein